MPKAILFYIDDSPAPWTAVPWNDGAFSVRIGRGKESDLTLPADSNPKALASVSRVHARIYSAGGPLQLEDLGSQNFTFLDERALLTPTSLTFPARVRLGSYRIELREESLSSRQIEELRRARIGEQPELTDTINALSTHQQVWMELQESGRWIHALIQVTDLVTYCQRADDFRAALERLLSECFGASEVSIDLHVDGETQLASLGGHGFEDEVCARVGRSIHGGTEAAPVHRVSNADGNKLAWIIRPMTEGRSHAALIVAEFDRTPPDHLTAKAADAFVTHAAWIGQALGSLLEALESGRAHADSAASSHPSGKALLTCDETGLWGRSPQFFRCIYEAEIAATRYVNLVERPGKVPTVFIQGESGTGKSALARFAHSMSKRQAGPFVDLNCSAIPVNLAESELFGYERGAHDKAFQSKPGQFELAAGGSLFLDEIGKTSLDFQSKLLKVLDTGEYMRIGGTKPLSVSCNVFVAESEDAQAMCDRGQMLPELWYRIRAFTVLVPPLRDRVEDIEEIATRSIERLNTAISTAVPKDLSPDFVRALSAYSWPGNVRELTQSIEVAFALCPAEADEISLNHLPDSIQRLFGLDRSAAHSNDIGIDTSRELDEVLNDIERLYLVKLMAECDCNVSEVTRRSGKAYNTVQSKLKDLREWIGRAADNGESDALAPLAQLAGDAWSQIRG